MQVIMDGNRLQIKAWVDGVQLEDSARAQLINVANLPFIHKHVAVMPDVHWGMGATVGSVIPTTTALVPAAVGVDIGCGMMAVKTQIKANDLPDNLHELRVNIEAVIPHGRSDNGGPNDIGRHQGEIPASAKVAFSRLSSELIAITTKYQKLQRSALTAPYHLGTLGTGNHFIEMCLDETNAVWLMLHSGSRGIGNAIGTFFISKAKETMERYFIKLPDNNLAYLVEGSELFNDYVRAVNWAQKFAAVNRKVMMSEVIAAVERTLGRELVVTEHAINCHHNYVQKEKHFGSFIWLTRKGAISAQVGELGIIPGSMGAKSYIVRGKGHREAFCSCSHGAGRLMSRNEAKRQFTLADHINATEGVECRKDSEVLDETPAAYKDIGAVMEAQKDLVDIVHTLKQVLCVKG